MKTFFRGLWRTSPPRDTPLLVERQDAIRVIDELYDSWYAVLVRYAARLAGGVDLAEEVVQQAFLDLYRALMAGAGVQNPRAWAFCVVRREVNRRIHQELKREVGFDEVDVLELLQAAPPERESFAVDDFERSMRLLSPREQEVVLLRLESLKYREIAARLDLSPNTVNTLLARALRKLKSSFTVAGAERSARRASPSSH